jgi:hypothetical protein
MMTKLLGHTQIRTTARDAHLAAEPVRISCGSVVDSLQRANG